MFLASTSHSFSPPSYLHVRARQSCSFLFPRGDFEMEPAPKRFQFSSPEQRQKLVEDAVPKKTAQSNAYWKSVFDKYCSSIGKSVNFATVTSPELAPILESFFVDVRGVNGEPYKGNSLRAAKGAIQRLLFAADAKINIFQDAEFQKMRKIFSGLLKERRRSGEDVREGSARHVSRPRQCSTSSASAPQDHPTQGYRE